MQNTYCDECGKRAHPGKCESDTWFVVEYYSHENEYHWQETGRFRSEEIAIKHYEIERRVLPNRQWRLYQCVPILESKPI